VAAKDREVYLDQQDRRDQEDPEVCVDLLDLKVQLESLVHPEDGVCLDLMDLRGPRVNLEIVVWLDLLDPKVKLVTLEDLARLDCKA